jgi:hypothetical protein
MPVVWITIRHYAGRQDFLTILPKSAAMQEETRDEAWLAERLKLLWEMHFSDVPQGFPIVTQFSTRAKYRLGCIAARNGRAIIQINRLYADPFVPAYVVDATIGHELAHYAHGYGSGLPLLHPHPHRGGVVDRELENRGLGEVSAKAEAWRKAHWDAFYQSQCGDLLSRETARTQSHTARWNAFLNRPECRTETELHSRMVAVALRLNLDAHRLPFSLEWLHATTRQTGPSYWFSKSRVLRLHGLLADRRVPASTLDFELAYWLARRTVGERWSNIHGLLCKAGMAAISEEALQWRKRRWPAFCARHHPLLTHGSSSKHGKG